MNLQKQLLTNNNCYKTGAKLAVKGIVVHSTGANNPNLKRYVGPDDGKLGVNANGNTWNQPKPDGREVCVHAFVGKLVDGSIATYQTLPWDMRGWHGGSGAKGSVNDTHIGFEICEDALADASYLNLVYQEAVELCAMLCKQYNIEPESPSLICHSEACSLGLASNHADVMHWWPKFNKSMNTFRADVANLLQGSQPAAPQPAPQPAAPAPPDSDVTQLKATVAQQAQQISALNGQITDLKSRLAQINKLSAG